MVAMKKWLKIALGVILGLIVLMLLFGKCESDIPKEKEVTVSNVEMSGYAAPYLKVVDGTYTFTQDGDDASISVKFELVKKPTEEFYDQSWAKFVLNPIGKNGSIYDLGFSKFAAEDGEVQKLKDLMNGNVGDTKNIVFSFGYLSSNKDKVLDIFQNAETFEIIDEAFTNEKDSTGDDTFGGYGSNDWDSILNEYEQFVDEYIAALNKAASGDIDAIQSSSDLMEKAESLSNRLENAKADLTSAQQKRLLKIQNKMANAAASM
jgi:hypothetical protein